MSVITGAQLRAEPVLSSEEVEALRLIRNACVGSFSHDNEEISQERQRAWWAANRGRVRAWLYFLNEDIVGYGLVRQDNYRNWWNSIAVLPAWRGRGFGSFITADVLTRWPWPVWSQIRLDNPAALSMHHYWAEIRRDETLVTLCSRLYAEGEG